MKQKSDRSEFIFGSDARPFTGRKMLALVLSFFIVIIAVNGIFAYFAVQSWSGLETEKSYEKGVRYNKTLAAAAAQAALGWQFQIANKKGAGQSYQIILRVDDKGGGPVAGLSITGELRRPIHENSDMPLKFRETKAGHYLVTVTTIAPGNWDLWAKTVARDGTPVRLERRLWLK